MISCPKDQLSFCRGNSGQFLHCSCSSKDGLPVWWEFCCYDFDVTEWHQNCQNVTQFLSRNIKWYLPRAISKARKPSPSETFWVILPLMLLIFGLFLKSISMLVFPPHSNDRTHNLTIIGRRCKRPDWTQRHQTKWENDPKRSHYISTNSISPL